MLRSGLGSYRLTPRALADLDAIAEYSLDRWGRVRTRKYLKALTDRMAWLAASPELGKRRDDVATGYMCFPEGSHLIFYVEIGGSISIIGVPHNSMDVGSHLR